MLALGASCPWFESKYPYLNGLCSVIRLAQDICNVLEEFKSHKVHTMFSCFHNTKLLLEPSFGQLEVKETALSMLLSSVVQNSSLTRKRSQVRVLQEQLMGIQLEGLCTWLLTKSYGFDSFRICIIGTSSNGQEATLIRQ